MDSFFEKFIADLVKGASASPYTGAKPSVEINHLGSTHKLAAFDEVSAVMEKLGFFTMHDPTAVAQQLVHGSGPLGPTAGALLPSPMPGAGKPPPIPAAAMRRGPPPIPAAAKMAFDQGSQAALEAFGVKEAFLPALAAIGGMAARALPAIGRAFTAAKPALSRAGGFLMKHPVGQQVAGTAASNMVNRAMNPQPQPQPAM